MPLMPGIRPRASGAEASLCFILVKVEVTKGRETMRRVIGAIVGLGMFVAAVSGGSAANPNASCNGVLVSSLAGQPGVVGELTREFHAEFKEAGIPPGFFDVAGAREHAGGVDECLAALSP
jgi:hypothetical protein